MSSPIRSNTQQQIDIEDIIDNLIIEKDGSCSLVLKTNAINFGLLSEEEQDATIYAYAAFLNSLTFSLQILIRSNLKDISGYIKQLEEKEIKQSNVTKKQQIHSYKNFISSLITERNVLEKNFYLIIPFSTLELGIGKSFTASFFKNKTSLPFEKTYIIEKAKANLEPKRDHVLRQLARMGLSARQLNTQELIQLLFTMYNASSTQGQKITNTGDYTVPLVQPAYIRQKEDFMSDQDQSINSAPPAPANNQPATPTPIQVPTTTPVAGVPPVQPTTPPLTQQTPTMPTSQTPPQPAPELDDAQNLINSAANDIKGTS